jgi:hypothetical protein
MGLTNFSVANSSLNGSGALMTVISGASRGTLIKTIIIKAQTNTDLGMVRLFVKKSGGDNILLTEINVFPITKSGRDPSYYTNISLNYYLASGEQLNVSTQVANTFNIIVEAFDYSYTTTTNYIGSSLAYKTNIGVGVITTANSSLDGSGAMSQIIVAGLSADGFKGCVINSILIKAQETTIPGMVRLFIQNEASETPVLFTEISIPSVVQSASTQSFVYEVIEEGTLCLPPGYSIWASTEVDNRFSVVIEAADWENLSV